MKKIASVLSISVLTSVMLAGCSTVRVPNVDFLKLPEFREIVKNNQTNVPDVSEVPDAPDNVRKDKAWDADARKLIALRDGFELPVVDESLNTPEQVDAEFARLESKVKAYKLDDPK